MGNMGNPHIKEACECWILTEKKSILLVLNGPLDLFHRRVTGSDSSQLITRRGAINCPPFPYGSTLLWTQSWFKKKVLDWITGVCRSVSTALISVRNDPGWSLSGHRSLWQGEWLLQESVVPIWIQYASQVFIVSPNKTSLKGSHWKCRLGSR